MARYDAEVLSCCGMPNRLCVAEVRKLYGHTDDVKCLTISSDGRLLASACKARDSEHAVILVWDTHT